MGGAVLFASMLWGKIPTGIKFGAIGLVAGVLVVWGSYTVGKHEGRQQATLAATQAVAKAYKDRAHENASVDSLNPYSLCRELGGLSDDCRPLMRGLGEDQSPAADSGVSGRP